jgi:hypothetical protein
MAATTDYEGVVLKIHVLAEIVAGTILLLKPSFFNPNATASHMETMRGVGNGALSIGVVGLALLNMDPRPTFLFAVLAQYHSLVVWLQLREPMPNMPAWLPPLFHGLLAFYFLQIVIM